MDKLGGEKMKKKLKLREWVKYTLLIALLIALLIVIDKDNEQFVESCTKNLSENVCMKEVSR